jgi:lipopolysaccharide biosynthesis regulator YciM
MPADYLPGLFWLLLPIAAASGWYLARRTAPRPPPPAGLGPSYVRGLNYLLNEQPDKAIEVFLQMLEVESETVETHLALGNLFRRRGEVDRAIRIHENLIARPALTTEQRWLAVQELGMDYMRSGLMDRAEGLFKELLEAKVQVRKTLGHLLDIYQQEQDWDTAIAYATELNTRCGDDTSAMVAQYHCEKAERFLARADHGQAAESLKEAQAADPDCVRASLMEGRLAMAADRPAEALAAYQRIETQDPEFLVEALPPLMGCYRALGRLDEFAPHVRSLGPKHAGITPVLLLSEILASQEGPEAVIAYLCGELSKRPSLRGLDRLLEHLLADPGCEARPYLELVKQFTVGLMRNRFGYKCRHCGFLAKGVHWQCPSCKRWGCVRPIYGIEDE